MENIDDLLAIMPENGYLSNARCPSSPGRFYIDNRVHVCSKL
jgi:hypothetical protein